MSVINKLPSLSAGSRKTGAINDVIETTLQHKEQIFARDTFLPRGFLKVIAELFFKHEVDALDLLLFTKLLPVTG